MTVLSDKQTKEDYQDHLVTWVEHCEYLKERGREVIEVLEAAERPAVVSTQAPVNNTTTAAGVTTAACVT